MEAKSRNSYQCVINFMKTNLFPLLVPETIITDYEIALRDTLLSLGTENTRVVGCWFHHNQVRNLLLSYRSSVANGNKIYIFFFLTIHKCV